MTNPTDSASAGQSLFTVRGRLHLSVHHLFIFLEQSLLTPLPNPIRRSPEAYPTVPIALEESGVVIIRPKT